MSALMTKTGDNTARRKDEESAHQLRDAAEEAGSTVRRFLEEKSEQAVELRKNTEKKITAHPLQAVAVAAVGGLLLGALLRR